MLDAEADSDPQMSDSEISWQSVTDVDSLTATNHWRGWKQQTSPSASTTTTTTTTNLNTIQSNSRSPSTKSTRCVQSYSSPNEHADGLIKIFSD